MIAPPYSDEAELAVLGAVMLSDRPTHTVLEVFHILGTWDAFYRERHRVIAQAMHRLVAKESAIDTLTLPAELEAGGDLARAGGKECIGVILEAVSTSANVAYHAGLIRQHFERRRLIEVGTALVQQAQDKSIDARKTATEFSQSILPIAVSHQSRGFLPMHEVITELQTDLIERAELNDRGVHIGYRSYLPEFDDLMEGGPEPGDLVSIMGVPGSGKSMIAIQWVINAALDGDEEAAIISAEMTRRHVAIRALQQVGTLRSRCFKFGEFEGNDGRDFIWARNVLAKAPLHIDDSTGPTIEAVATKARLLKLQRPRLSAIVVDFLQLLHVESDNDQNKAERLTRISYDLKSLAKELGIVVLSLVQPNVKEIRRRPDERPDVSDAQGSSGIEQASDQMVLIWPKWKVKLDQNVEGRPVTLIVAKNRHGANGEIDLQWEAEYMRVSSERRYALDRERRVRLRHPSEARQLAFGE